jgi:DNA-binding winged helix-turn-helix (wHTH) protein/Tol biopolymer transport system component
MAKYRLPSMETIERPGAESPTYCFGAFRFGERERSLQGPGGPVRLTPKAADLLLALVSNPGHVISKDELIRRVWRETFVADTNLTFQMNRLRRILGDDAASPAYIETVPGRGYRFICPVRVITGPDPVPDLPSPVMSGAETEAVQPAAPVALANLPEGTWRRLPGISIKWRVLAFALPVALIATMAWVYAIPSLPRITSERQLSHDGAELKVRGIVSAGKSILTVTDEGMAWFNPAGRAIDPPEHLAGYRLLDVAEGRSEALATKPEDRGGELGLWMVSLDPRRKDAAARVGDIKVTGPVAGSHDGKRIAFARQEGDYGSSLNIVDRAGVGHLVSKPFAATIISIRWRPDDRVLRLTLVVRANRTNMSSLWDVNVDGSNDHMVLAGSGDFQPYGGDWLPNGLDYIFQAGDRTTELWLVRDVPGWRRHFHRPHLERLGREGYSYSRCRASADGRRIYCSAAPPPDLVRYDRTERSWVPFLPGLAARALGYSREGKSLVYVRELDSTLWRARADGTKPQQLTYPPMTVSGASWSPDGARLALRGKSPGRQDKVYIMPAEGGPPQAISSLDVNQGIPSWSADGKQIAYGDVPEAYGVPTGVERISLFDVERKVVTTLTGSEGLWTPRWSPDGKWLAALTVKDGAVRIWDVRRRGWSSLNVSGVTDLRWSHDSAYLWCYPNGPQYVRVHAADTRPAEWTVEAITTRAPGDAGWSGLSLEGDLINLRYQWRLVALELKTPSD